MKLRNLTDLTDTVYLFATWCWYKLSWADSFETFTRKHEGPRMSRTSIYELSKCPSTKHPMHIATPVKHWRRKFVHCFLSYSLHQWCGFPMKYTQQSCWPLYRLPRHFHNLPPILIWVTGSSWFLKLVLESCSVLCETPWKQAIKIAVAEKSEGHKLG